MGQTARSVHFCIRRGGYAPLFGLHTTAVFAVVEQQVSAILPELAALVPDTCSLAYWEWQEANGTVISTHPLDEGGTYANYFSSMLDCTYFRWASTGPDNDSGGFLHPRPVDAYAEGVARPTWAALIAAFASQVVAANFTDSEGFPITGMISAKPSRRRRVRVAP